jgi:Uma2 family endonuclease
MTQAARRISFEDYLELDETESLAEGRAEYWDGELRALPPEAEMNDWIADYLFLLLANTGLFAAGVIRPHTCEIEVPVLEPGDPKTRFPDLVILRQEHLTQTRKRLTLKRDMPPPLLVVEVVSPGDGNRSRDYERKRSQYEALDIGEYWLIDPQQQLVIVLKLQANLYVEVGQFRGTERIESPTFPSLELTAQQVLSAGR